MDPNFKNIMKFLCTPGNIDYLFELLLKRDNIIISSATYNKYFSINFLDDSDNKYIATLFRHEKYLMLFYAKNKNKIENKDKYKKLFQDVLNNKKLSHYYYFNNYTKIIKKTNLRFNFKKDIKIPNKENELIRNDSYYNSIPKRSAIYSYCTSYNKTININKIKTEYKLSKCKSKNMRKYIKLNIKNNLKNNLKLKHKKIKNNYVSNMNKGKNNINKINKRKIVPISKLNNDKLKNTQNYLYAFIQSFDLYYKDVSNFKALKEVYLKYIPNQIISSTTEFGTYISMHKIKCENNKTYILFRIEDNYPSSKDVARMYGRFLTDFYDKLNEYLKNASHLKIFILKNDLCFFKYHKRISSFNSIFAKIFYLINYNLTN